MLFVNIPLITPHCASISRSIWLHMVYKVGVLKNFHKIYRKTPVLESLFNKLQAQAVEVCNFIKRDTLTQMRSCEYYNIFKNTFFTEKPPGWLVLHFYLQCFWHIFWFFRGISDLAQVASTTKVFFTIK